MGYEPRLITFFKNGLVKYYKPWLIAQEAFPEISNAYAWRGSVRKREGYELLATLPAGDLPVQGLKYWINPATLSQTTVAFSLTKAYVFNVISELFQDITFFASPAGTAFSFNNTTFEYYWTCNYAGSLWVTNDRFTQVAATPDNMYFWNGNPGVVGVSGGWSIFLPTVHGDVQLRTALIILPYKGRLVVLNTVEGPTQGSGSLFPSRARWSQIGTPYTSNTKAVAVNDVPAGTGITPGNPTVIKLADTSSFTIGKPAGITNVIGSIAAVLNFNQFNVSAIVPNVSITIDVDTTGLVYTSGGLVQGPGTTIQPQPYEISIFGWRDDIPGRGGYVDADTSERIVSAEIVKDVLVVFFQRSTWRLRYTGNEILPFIWERINTQYGAESTFSNIPFDEMALAFSRFGWVGADTNSVARIDENIPDSSFSVKSETQGLIGLNRIQGIRDYFRQMAYWTFPSVTQGEEPDQIYAYNYIDKNWSIFSPSDTIRVFGTFVKNEDMTWANLSGVNDTWANFNSVNDIWSNFGSSQNLGFPEIIGGDNLGNVYTMFQFGQTINTDNNKLFGFDILTKRFNPYIEQGLKCRIGYVDVYCSTVNAGEITFNHYVDDQLNPVFTRNFEIYPRGLVSIFNILTGLNTIVVTNTAHNLVNGQSVTITDVVGTLDMVLNNNSFIINVLNPVTFVFSQDSTGFTYVSGGNVNTGILTNYGSATYTRIYLGAIAHMHQFEFTLTDAQIADPKVGSAQFELQGLVIWSRPSGRIRG